MTEPVIVTVLLKGIYPPSLNGVEVKIIPDHGDFPPRDRLITVRIIDRDVELAHGYDGEIRVPPICLAIS